MADYIQTSILSLRFIKGLPCNMPLSLMFKAFVIFHFT